MPAETHDEMKANPGGQIDPKNVVGRDGLIKRIWERLERQCVVIDSVRRIGKSSVIKKMVAEPPDEWFPIYQDVESIQSADDFAQNVHNSVQEFLGHVKRGLNVSRAFLERIQLKWVSLKGRPWTEILESAVGDALEAKQGELLVLFWDEFPLMVENIRRAEGEEEAANVLSTLRSLRHNNRYSKLRMVYTGSIGLHHVLAKIVAAKIPASPIDDMDKIEVSPLALDDARELARRIIRGERLPCKNFDQAASTIATEADRVPYYIHHIVSGLRRGGVTVDRQQIQAYVERQLRNVEDPWNLAYYQRRISPYYKKKDAPLVEIVLDALARNNKALKSDKLLREVNTFSDSYDDPNNLYRVLCLMERDHYLAQISNDTYQFKFSLMRRWWKLNRRLS